VAPFVTYGNPFGRLWRVIGLHLSPLGFHLGAFGCHWGSMWRHFAIVFYKKIKMFFVFKKKRAMKRPNCENVSVFVGPNGGV